MSARRIDQNSDSDRPNERRRFLNHVSIVLSAAATAAIVVPVIGFLLGPVIMKTPQVWRRVKRLDELPIGQTTKVSFVDASPLPWAGVTGRTAAWLHRASEDEVFAFSVNCTHLGCPVRWLESAELFMCPCHGGVYYNDGTVAAGPPPEPLFRYHVRIRNGAVEILTSPLPIAGD